MMMEDRENRKVDPLLQNRSGKTLNLNIPMNLLSNPTSSSASPPPVIKQGGQEVVPFKVFHELPQPAHFLQLLLKQKGAKQPKAVEVAIPNSERMLSNNLIAHQAQQQEEMQEMKRRVLRYDERDRQLDEEEKKRGEFDTLGYPYSPAGRQKPQRESKAPQRGYNYPCMSHKKIH